MFDKPDDRECTVMAHDREVAVLRQRSRNRWAVALRRLAVLLFGLITFMILGALVLLFMVDVVAEAILAVLTALTPTP
jgi:hypothetical protein